MEKILLIINAHTGRVEIRHRILDILETFTGAGYLTTCVMTQYPGHATELAQSRGADYDRVICCGGDGTVNEVLNGLMTLDRRPALGILPMGTINDYAYSLSIPGNIIKAAEIAAGQHLFPIDVGSFNGRYFSYVSGFGLFTDVTYETNQGAKNVLGIVAYWLEGIKRVSSIKKYRVRVEHDGGVLEEECIVGLFSNSVSIAGIRTAYQNALLDDGKLEICLIRPPKTLSAMRDLIDALLNVRQISDMEESDFVTVIHTKKAIVTCNEPLSWTVDGENGGAFALAEIQAYQQAITVITGQDMRQHSFFENH